MEPLQVFLVQFFLSLVAWLSIAWWYLIPWLDSKSRSDALAILILPQLFRHIGATLLVPGVVSPDLPVEFARGVAYGDLVTAVLAVIALTALKLKLKKALLIIWLFNLIGMLDLLHNLIQGARWTVAPHLHAAWVVPTFGVPMMLLSHLLIFRRLIRR